MQVVFYMRVRKRRMTQKVVFFMPQRHIFIVFLRDQLVIWHYHHVLQTRGNVLILFPRFIEYTGVLDAWKQNSTHSLPHDAARQPTPTLESPLVAHWPLCLSSQIWSRPRSVDALGRERETSSTFSIGWAVVPLPAWPLPGHVAYKWKKNIRVNRLPCFGKLHYKAADTPTFNSPIIIIIHPPLGLFLQFRDSEPIRPVPCSRAGFKHDYLLL